MTQAPTTLLNVRFALFGVAALAMGIIALSYANPSFGAPNAVANAVVDIRLIPDNATVSPGAQFNVAIQVEPNGQEVAGVQAFVNFDPAILQVTALTLESSSPLTVQLLNEFDNSAGQIDFAAGSFTSSPNTTFVAANIAFNAANVDAATTLSLSRESPRETIASVGADEVLRDLMGAEIIIGNPLPTPTPSPVPTDTPTPKPTPTPTVTNTPVVTPTPQSDTPTPTNTATPTAAPTATPSSTAVPIPTATPPPSQVVDMRLESNVDSLIGGESFKVAVIIEPNGQEVTGVEAFITYDPGHVTARSVRIDPSSPLNQQMANSISSETGVVRIGAGVLGPGPTSAFTMANVEFDALIVGQITEIMLSVGPEDRKSVASVDGFEVQRNLLGATVTIIEPTPTPVPPQRRVDLQLKLESDGTTSWIPVDSTFEAIIQVDPNGQEVSGIQTFIDFDPTKVTASNPKIAPGSPIDTELLSVVDNDAGSLIFAAGTLGEPVTQPFDLAVIEFLTSSQPSTTSIEFSTADPRSTIASVQGVEVQRDVTGIDLQIDPHSDLRITKTGTPGIVRAGDTLIYTLEVENVGPEPAIDVLISDELPDGMAFERATPSQGQCSPQAGVVVCNLGELASGATVNVQISVIPGKSLLGEKVVNEAVVASPRFDPISLNNTASTTVEIPSISDVGLVAMAGVFATILLVRIVRDAKQS